ncbi:MAG: hypothetical protein BroJett038_26460 [Chloroflexota bacterium]|nr:MAG: hypothetical protein BroJett038_26460 [Chloroflexota bacterium]
MDGDRLLFKVNNRHEAFPGTAPFVDGDVTNKYCGYFENEYGEQSVFVYDYSARQGMVWSGDAGWHESYQVVDGQALGLVFTRDEAIWLMNCWQTAKLREGK